MRWLQIVIFVASILAMITIVDFAALGFPLFVVVAACNTLAFRIAWNTACQKTAQSIIREASQAPWPLRAAIDYDPVEIPSTIRTTPAPRK